MDRATPEHWMREAIVEAHKAGTEGEVPVGTHLRRRRGADFLNARGGRRLHAARRICDPLPLLSCRSRGVPIIRRPV